MPEPGAGTRGVRWLERHLARLRASGQALGFPQFVIEEGCAALEACAAGDVPGIWRVTVSRPGISEEGKVDWGGTGGVGVRHRAFHEPERPRLGLAAGYYLPDDVLRVHKSTSFLRYVEARRQARLQGFDDAILVSGSGLVGEASAANIVVVLDGKAVTPPLCGIVAGVTRAGLLEIGAQRGWPIEERAIRVEELAAAQEIVLVSAGVGAVSAASLLGRPLGTMWGERMRGWLDNL